MNMVSVSLDLPGGDPGSRFTGMTICLRSELVSSSAYVKSSNRPESFLEFRNHPLTNYDSNYL
jgi:hypothetical protein